MFGQKLLVSPAKIQLGYAIRYPDWKGEDIEIMEVRGLQNLAKKLKSSNLDSNYGYMLVSNFLDGEKKRLNSVEKHVIHKALQS